MPTTTEGEVFRELLIDLQAILLAATPSFDGDRVYIRAVAGFDPEVKPPYVQIVPGSANVVHEDSGVLLIDQTFQVVVYNRLALGEPGIDTGRITDSTYGLMKLRGLHRGDGNAAAPTGLIHRIISTVVPTAITVHRIVLQSWSVPQTNPADPYWVMATDTYRFMWEIL